MQDLIDAIKGHSITTALIISGAIAHAMAAWGAARSKNTEYDYIDGVIAFSTALVSGLIFAMFVTAAAGWWGVEISPIQRDFAAIAGAFLGLVGAQRLLDIVLDRFVSGINRREP